MTDKSSPLKKKPSNFAKNQSDIMNNDSITTFPSKNPYPVLRMSRNGTILYSNDASLALLGESTYSAGQLAPNRWRQLGLEALSSGFPKEIEETVNDKIFSFYFIPVQESEYVNIYGRDITDWKRLDTKNKEHTQRLEELVKERTKELSDTNERLQRE